MNTLSTYPRGEVIGLCGGIGCGKTSVADQLVSDYGFVELSFADKLKRTVIDLFQLPESACYGTQAEKMAPIQHLGPVAPSFGWGSDVWRSRAGEPWCGRWILEFMGTDACRAIWPPIWVEAVKKQVIEQWRTDSECEKAPTRFVVSDLRFENERLAIKELGGLAIRVEVEGDHSKEVTGHASDNWYATAVVDHVLSAPKPGLQILGVKTDGLMRQLALYPRVVNLDERRKTDG